MLSTYNKVLRLYKNQTKTAAADFRTFKTDQPVFAVPEVLIKVCSANLSEQFALVVL